MDKNRKQSYVEHIRGMRAPTIPTQRRVGRLHSRIRKLLRHAGFSEPIIEEYVQAVIDSDGDPVDLFGASDAKILEDYDLWYRNASDDAIRAGLVK